MTFDVEGALATIRPIEAQDPQAYVEQLADLYKRAPGPLEIREAYAASLYKYTIPKKNPSIRHMQILLYVISLFSFSEEYRDYYFRNIDIIGNSLNTVPSNSGRLLVGIGPGRCGSTALWSFFRDAREGVATHENPPVLSWPAADEAVDFHIARFRALQERFGFVFDAAHWWINSLDRLADAFPDLKVVGLKRNLADCAASFIRVKGAGPGAIHHWIDHDGGYYQASHWDRAYPSYDAFTDAKTEDARRNDTILRYVSDYNDRMTVLAAQGRIELIETEALSAPETISRLRALSGLDLPDSMPVRNQNSIADSEQPTHWV